MNYKFLVLLLFVLPASAQTLWGDEAADTIRVNDILARYASRHASAAQLTGPIAREFLGTPYAAATLEHNPEETLTVRLDSLDCTTFVETVTALALTASEGRTSWRDFERELRGLRYRRGEIDGYASRLHYISDWIVDNASRGNIVETTSAIPGAEYAVKTLDFMSSHPDAYRQLADPAQLAAVKRVEEAYRSHRFPILRKQRLLAAPKARQALREGDIVFLTTDIPGLDVSHAGFVTIVDGEPTLLHASSAQGRVVVDTLPLAAYLKRAKRLTGIRVVRPAR